MTGTSTSESSAGASSPVRQLMCEQATSVVRSRTALASSANGTARISTPRCRAAISGPIRPGCSSVEVTISSPGPMSMPASTLPSPSLVPVVSAMSSTGQPSSSA